MNLMRKAARSQMFPKPKRYENEEYLEFIRGLDCCVPGCNSKNVVRKGKYTKVEAHHTKTVASGGSDLTAVPLHDIHHTEAHLSQVKFQEKYGIDFKEVQISCLQKFIEDKIPIEGRE